MQFPKAPESEDKVFDDQLASLTDQILAGEKSELTEMNDAEAAKLHNTVLRIRTALWVERPDAAMIARIHARLQREWKNVWQARSAAKPWSQRWPQFAIAGALVVLLLVVMLFWGSPAAEAMPGTADHLLPWAPLLGSLGIILIVLLVWIDRRR